VLGDVGDGLGGYVVSGCLPVRIRTLGQVDPQAHRDRAAGHQSRQGSIQTAPVEHRRVDAPHQTAQFLDGGLGVPVGPGHQEAGTLGILLEPSLGQAEIHGQCHQPRLEPVVQIPFHAAPLGLRGGDRGGTRCGQPVDLSLPRRREHDMGGPAVATQQRRRGQHGEHDTGREQCHRTHRDPGQVTPGRRVGEQPAQPSPPALVRAAGPGPVRLGDGHATPRRGQPSGLVGQPPRGQQEGREQEQAGGQPRERSRPQDDRHPRRRVEHEPGAEPGEHQRRGQRQHQHGAGQRQSAQGQPAGRGEEAAHTSPRYAPAGPETLVLARGPMVG
jgi:hypothetical protein